MANSNDRSTTRVPRRLWKAYIIPFRARCLSFPFLSFPFPPPTPFPSLVFRHENAMRICICITGANSLALLSPTSNPSRTLLEWSKRQKRGFGLGHISNLLSTLASTFFGRPTAELQRVHVPDSLLRTSSFSRSSECAMWRCGTPRAC